MSESVSGPQLILEGSSTDPLIVPYRVVSAGSGVGGASGVEAEREETIHDVPVPNACARLLRGE